MQLSTLLEEVRVMLPRQLDYHLNLTGDIEKNVTISKDDKTYTFADPFPEGYYMFVLYYRTEANPAGVPSDTTTFYGEL